MKAKHALRGLTLSLAAEYAAKKIRVFSVSPGFMETAMTARWDARLVDAIKAAAAVTDPAAAARRVCELVEGTTVKGEGEDYSV